MRVSPAGMTAIDYARRSLRSAERTWSQMKRLPHDSPERHALILRHPESPIVIAKVIRAMESVARRLPSPHARGAAAIVARR